MHGLLWLFYKLQILGPEDCMYAVGQVSVQTCKEYENYESVAEHVYCLYIRAFALVRLLILLKDAGASSTCYKHKRKQLWNVLSTVLSSQKYNALFVIRLR